MAHEDRLATTTHASTLTPSTDGRGLVPPVLRERDAATYLGLSRSYLKKARIYGRGPVFVRVQRTILYRTADLDGFLERHVVRHAA